MSAYRYWTLADAPVPAWPQADTFELREAPLPAPGPGVWTKAASGTIPAAANTGPASLRMRPLGSARMSFSLASLDTTCLQ